ncbi:hypothetical protein DPMN_074103 [Dreissena polymorpha]|uniref:Uncharacterized protein n=1 Tax=Dreissena polymorpha TaxID=45954 RepID=A0A9D3YEL7_DREPO|nr:hypothetical protein DPMN_074103 [Dreissena polymorpha]
MGIRTHIEHLTITTSQIDFIVATAAAAAVVVVVEVVAVLVVVVVVVAVVVVVVVIDVQYSQSGTNIIRGYATARLLVRGGRIVCSRGVSPWHSASIRTTTPSLY